MRQWDIDLYAFEKEGPHPVVVLSNDELCANPDIQYVIRFCFRWPAV